MQLEELSASPSDAGGAFCSTRWSVVLAARDESGRREALESLCRSYWLPVYCFVRRRGKSPTDAEDLTQGFFLHMLEGGFFDRLDPQKGRFRGYLCGALKHYLVSQVRRETSLKRGGGVEIIHWEDASAEERFAEYDRPGLDPESAYDHHWALTLLNRSFERLTREQELSGKGEAFAVLRPFLTSAPGPGDYETAAEKLGTTRKHIGVLVHRLMQRLGEVVRIEVAETVADPSEVADEMKHLQAALRG